VGGGASCPAAKLAQSEHRAGASVDAAQRAREQWGLGVSEGIFCLACVEASSRGGWFSGLDAHTVSKRRECPRTRQHQVGQSPRALDDDGVGLELAPVSTGERAELLVSRALWWRGQAPEAYRECCGSP